MITFKEYLVEQEKDRVPGKTMGHDLYVHKDYTDGHPKIPQKGLDWAKDRLPAGFEYTAVKYNKKDGTHSFIHSPDFDTAHEPTVGKSIKVHPDGTTKVTNPSKDPKIRHHKWQWGKDDYKGFSVPQSKARSKHWRDIVGTNKEVYSRIGSKSYCDREVVPKLNQ